MEIGKPQRIHRVEPLENPVPQPKPREPEKAPVRPRKTPAK
jgi:hypothetical protein